MDLLDEARASIAPFCVKHCDALCCRKGSLPLTEKNQKIILDGIKGRRVRTLENGMIALELDGACPKLQGNLCSIYENEHKPAACSQFPLMQVGKMVIAIQWCPAVQQKQFSSYFEKLEEQGYTIIDE